MANKKIGVAVLAAGGRSRGVVGNLLRDSGGNVEILSVFDPDREVMKGALEVWKSPNARQCSSAEEAIGAPGVEWVMVFSPNVYHCEQILASFAAGKHVFAEKPLATSIDDCKRIYDAQQASGRLFMTGFVLRYSKLYRKVKEILDSGKLGRVIALEGNENITPAHGGYIMANWRRHTRYAGPHILEKCCHDLDLILWFLGALPSRVAAFGGRDFFTPENRKLEDKYGVSTFKNWWDPHAIETPFTDDTDLMDNLVSAAEFRGGIRVSFTATMSNAIPERRLSFSCSEGTLKVELYEGVIRYSTINDEGVTVISMAGDGHGGGDSFIMKELFETMTKGTPPGSSGVEGLRSAVYALAIDQAATTGKVVDLEPVWTSLGQ